MLEGACLAVAQVSELSVAVEAPELVGTWTYFNDSAHGHTPGYLTPAYLPTNR